MTEPTQPTLVEFLHDLRAQLQESMEAAAGERLVFALQDVQVELTVTATRDRKSGGHLRFWVIEAGGDAGTSRVASQTLTLNLRPSVRDGQTPYVNGAAQSDER